jgi:hypothetical protein
VEKVVNKELRVSFSAIAGLRVVLFIFSADLEHNHIGNPLVKASAVEVLFSETPFALKDI